MSKHTIIATFDSNVKARMVLDQLCAAGIAQEEISVLMSERGRKAHFAIDTGHKVPEGAATGGMVGGALGAIVAALTVVGVIAIPGVGLLAAGPVVAALAGAGVGGAGGTLIGGLIGLGFTEHQAKLVEKAALDGHIVIGVQTKDGEKAKLVERAFEEIDAVSVAA